MSHQASRRALEWRGGTTTERHVLAVIGIETDHHTDWATVTLEELAKETGCARSTIIATVARLVAMEVLERQGSGGRNPTRYRVLGSDNRPARPDGSQASTDRPDRSVQPTGNRPIFVAQPTGNRPATDRHQLADQDGRRPLIEIQI